MQPDDIEILVMLQNLIYHGGVSEYRRQTQRPSLFSNKHVEKSPEKGEPYCVAHYDSEGKVTYSDPE